jgi:hypothetical protein
MAKRAPVDEEPYRPLLDPGVITAALTKAATPGAGGQKESQALTPKVIELSRPEPPRAELKPRIESQEGILGRSGVGEGRASAHELVEKFDQERRLLLTRSEAAALDRMVISLAGRLSAQVKLSHVLRGLICLLLNAEAEVDKRAGEAPILIRPPNGDAKALHRFEREISRILAAALRDAGPLREG